MSDLFEFLRYSSTVNSAQLPEKIDSNIGERFTTLYLSNQLLAGVASNPALKTSMTAIANDMFAAKAFQNETLKNKNDPISDQKMIYEISAVMTCFEAAAGRASVAAALMPLIAKNMQ